MLYILISREISIQFPYRNADIVAVTIVDCDIDVGREISSLHRWGKMLVHIMGYIILIKFVAERNAREFICTKRFVAQVYTNFPMAITSYGICQKCMID